MYRLIAFDLDGTLLNDELVMSPRVRRALDQARERGIWLTLASGRGYPALRPWVDDLGWITPLICYQGAVVADAASGRAVFQLTFPKSQAVDLVAFACERHLELLLFADDVIYVENKLRPDAYYDKWFGGAFQVVDDLLAATPAELSKFIIVGDGEDLDFLRPEVERRFGDHLQIVRSHRFFLEGLANEATKGNALAWLAARLGVAREETMAIGDSGNDRSMIAWAGLGVAVGNASDEAKSAADYIAPSVDEDGVAEVLERFCLRNGNHE